MKNRRGPVGLLVAGAVLLTGCGASTATGDQVVPGTAKARRSTPAPAMSMGPGESMAGMSMPKTKVSGPSKSAAMICKKETEGRVTTLAGLSSPAPKKATWADNLYTCTYRLPAGPLVLSVKESANPAAARGYFNTLRARIGGTHPVTGLAALGLPGFEKQTGKVVFVKDNSTLQVDATALPDQVGPKKISRQDLAYTVAANVLACWSEK